MAEDMGRELGWDDAIEKDSSEYTLLPEGEYPFEVITFERGRFAGSEKMTACNMATIHIRIDGGQLGATLIKHKLYLNTKTEGLLSQFFTSIGQRSHGEKINMNWNNVPGSTGRAKVGIREWDKDNGEKGRINEIKRFLDPPEKVQTSFKAGEF